MNETILSEKYFHSVKNPKIFDAFGRLSPLPPINSVLGCIFVLRDHAFNGDAETVLLAWAFKFD